MHLRKILPPSALSSFSSLRFKKTLFVAASFALAGCASYPSAEMSNEMGMEIALSDTINNYCLDNNLLSNPQAHAYWLDSSSYLKSNYLTYDVEKQNERRSAALEYAKGLNADELALACRRHESRVHGYTSLANTIRKERAEVRSGNSELIGTLFQPPAQTTTTCRQQASGTVRCDSW